MVNPGYVGAAGTMIGGILEVWGAIEAGKASKEEGRRQQVAQEFKAQQIEQLVGQIFASAQRDAQEEKRQAHLVASRALAVAAASGGSATDVNIVRNIGRIKGEGAYRAAVAMYQAESEGRQLRLQAATARIDGSYARLAGANKNAYYANAAIGSSIKTGTSMYEKYASKGEPAGDGKLPTAGDQLNV